jgi:3-keto-5-aminohexanoate cleavage enzyme
MNMDKPMDHAAIHELYSGILSNVHTEKPHLTMNKKLIINVAPTGAFMNRQQNPGQPYTMDENVQAVVEAYKEGAAVWHVHARDHDGTASKDPEVLKETIARVLDKCPDIVTSVIPYADYGTGHGVELVKRTVDVLTQAGPEYMQSAVLLIQTTAFSEKFVFIITEKTLSEQVKYLEDHGVRPEFQATSYQAIKDVLDWLVAKGVVKDPPLMNIMAGFHGFCHGSPLGPDPWNYIYLMTMQQTLAANAVKGVCAGGRNWLPFCAQAMMLGFDMVRVGMEDTVYLYPHREEKIQSSAQAVRKVVEIANALGREIATPAEAREIMGIRYGAAKAAEKTATAAQ